MAYPVGPVVEHYGGRVPTRQGLYLRVRCPFHGDTHPSASINQQTQRFHCFVCDFNGDAIAIVRWQEGCSYADALTKVEAITGKSDGQVRKPAGDSEWLSPRAGDRDARRPQVETWRLFGP